MILAVASGKGGTGKTTVAVNLALSLDREVFLLDCDVEEPNAHLFLKGEKIDETVASVPIPSVDENLCNGCGECGSFCRYHAIISFGSAPLVFPEMCHGCGGCEKVCPENAITEIPHRIGSVEAFLHENVTLVHGRLDIGATMAPPLIRAVKSFRSPLLGKPENTGKGDTAGEIEVIVDSPPGASCPVVAAINGADAVVLVTEPTPFGLHDLTIAVDMVRQLGIPFGVVVNRMGIGDLRVHSYCAENHIPLLLEIPDDRRIAEAYSRGVTLVDALPEYREVFRSLARKIARLPVEHRAFANRSLGSRDDETHKQTATP